MLVRVVIAMEIEARSERDVFDVIETMLDNGDPQDTINEHEHPDAKPMRVKSAVVRKDVPR